MKNPADIFTQEWARAQFPPERTDAFFDALFGDAEEGAYSIHLRYVKSAGQVHEFVFELQRRPGKCLVCSLTYGLPQVFSRHPLLNVKGLVATVAEALGHDPARVQWELLPTQEHSEALHSIPLVVTLA